MARPRRASTCRWPSARSAAAGSSASRYAGTYDQNWLDERLPVPAAGLRRAPTTRPRPDDQQLPVPVGGRWRCSLRRLRRRTGDAASCMPHFEAPVHVFPKKGEREDLMATLDTIVFEPDHERFTMTWRVARPLKKSMFEIAQVLVGKKGGSGGSSARRSLSRFPS
ncbi:MAG: DUF2169 domain-containing protein [Chromatiales bacterium]|nr:DUF2169 domain-containing protein [Chromatiales bacterium]